MNGHEEARGAAAAATTGDVLPSLELEGSEVEGDLVSVAEPVIGERVLLVYPEGDCDWVTVLDLTEDAAMVQLPDGQIAYVAPESVGVL